MELNVLTVIMLITVAISIYAFNNQSVMDRLLFNPYDIKQFGNRIRIIGHVFIHADWIHLILNMMVLFTFGKALLFEFGYHFGNLQGQLHFFSLYFLGALFASLIPYVRNHDNPSYRSLGASGAVSAVVFAFIIWNPSLPLRLLFIPFDIPAYIFGPGYLLLEYILDKRGGTGVAHDAHIGGALFGVLYALIINIDKGKEFFHAIFK